MKNNTFNAFRSRNFKLFFAGQSVSLIGTWMQKTAVSWVVYSLTNSKFMLGLTLFASMFPSFILSFIGGVISDRYNRYKVLLATQVCSMVQAILLTIAVSFKGFGVWEIIALSAVLGVINAFDVPARQSLMVELVDNKKDLPNALALNSSMVNLSRLIGPGIAGLAIERLGDPVCFGLNAVSFIAVIISLMMMRLHVYKPTPRTKNIKGELQEGLAYINRTPSIKFVIVMLGLMSFFVLPYATLMPVYAKDIFHGGASAFGVIDSAIGLGALAGAIYLASLRRGADFNRVLAFNTFIFGIGLILFSHTPWYLLALLFAALGAFGMMSQITITNMIIQTTVDPAMRGRVISLYAMAFFGMQPLGALLIGFVSQYAGVKNTILCEGVIALGIGVLHMRYLRKKRFARKAALDIARQNVRIAMNV